jgi:polyferredoxin
MLKKIRVAISVAIFAAITFYLLDFAGLMPNSAHVLAQIQFVPAVLTLLSGSVIVFAVLVVLTLLFGRVYCSSICPMGVFQDIASWAAKRMAKKGKRKRYKYSPDKTILRWAVLAVTIVAFIAGFPFLLGLIDPYSAFGRIIVDVFRPVYMAGNNLLESIFSHFGNYTFYKVEIFIMSIASFAIGIVTFLAIGFLARKYGRIYCNTICPVGTVLGFLSRFSLFKVRIDLNKCTTCGVCASKCKSSCIDSKNHRIDYSRCVNCFNCLGACREKAMSFALPQKARVNERQAPNTGVSRRQFLLTGLTTAAAIPAAIAEEAAGIISDTDKSRYIRQTPITPPGSLSAEHLFKHCTSCHLCITRCPTNILKPAFMEYGIGGIMQPVMYFEKGFCNYDCTICSDVCPSHALLPLTIDEKHRTQIGRVTLNENVCVVHAEGTNCGACAEHCPTQAVTMVPFRDGLTAPSINPDICVGCGGCEFICPVRPYRAIHVEGNTVHLEAKAYVEENKKEVEIDSFGF